ncbi:hypothetical protein [Nocardioides currus]|uniref:Indole-3-glycerol phosphate synthase n=1 Tax=Nocardioides currus TaxID=2133958 RepID=A0A2R7Z358_9ACTN|nr:hypothetical protein [Nocardioides currus]PUA83068.1 hypothetical protein C7S10_01065 [Nocardioides currus]
MTDDISDGVGTYDVVLLVETAMSGGDATQVRSLHSDIEDQVVYHVLLPLEDASARIEASLGTLGAGDVMAAPSMVMSDIDLDAVRQECRDRSDSDLALTVKAIEAAGGKATGTVTSEPPVDALAAKVSEVDAREVIVLTRPHLVAEFFHVDWTSRARRKLGVPVLHLLEHENFDEQSGGGEGVSGF